MGYKKTILKAVKLLVIRKVAKKVIKELKK